MTELLVRILVGDVRERFQITLGLRELVILVLQQNIHWVLAHLLEGVRQFVRQGACCHFLVHNVQLVNAKQQLSSRLQISLVLSHFFCFLDFFGHFGRGLFLGLSAR